MKQDSPDGTQPEANLPRNCCPRWTLTPGWVLPRRKHVGVSKGTIRTTTPFDMTVLNNLDRFHLFDDVIDRLPQLGARAACTKQAMRDKLIEHKQYIRKYGEDRPDIRNWKWGVSQPGSHEVKE